MAGFVVSREKFPWFPTINYDACTRDLDCLNFCVHEVFDWDPATGRPVVAHPYDCVPGCTSCIEVCKAGALSLPSKQQWRSTLRRLRAQAPAVNAPVPNR
jgi:NAD-dependent dihydropyrimidine dehydrogenase PreA subunit